ncbi:hypothetical protein P3342_009884 [Pyrenophora teres f. teres]|nr:hypothetical protein P3342_009884 [Pyrenophora teres f. teres]
MAGTSGSDDEGDDDEGEQGCGGEKRTKMWVNHDGGAQSSAGTTRLGLLLVDED